MKNYIFLGWSSENDKLSLKEIAKEYDYYHIKLNIIIQFILKKIIKFNAFGYLVYKIVKKNLPNQGINILIFCDDILFIKLSKYFKGENKILVFRNTISPDKEKYLKMFDYIFSFDPNDCESYKIKFLNQIIPYRYILNKGKTEPVVYDLYFVGQDKGRREKINRIKKLADYMGLKYYLLVIPNITWLRRIHDFLINKKTTISYKKNIELVCRSFALVDINKGGQNGITLRVLEAYILGKKIISNNKNILKLGFPRENIFILDNEISKLPDSNFFNKDADTRYLSESDFKRFSLNNLIENIKNLY